MKHIKEKKLLTWLMTKKIRRVRPVHINFWLKGTLVSGCWTSGKNATKGLTKSRNRTGEHKSVVVQCQWHQINRRVAL